VVDEDSDRKKKQQKPVIKPVSFYKPSPAQKATPSAPARTEKGKVEIKPVSFYKKSTRDRGVKAREKAEEGFFKRLLSRTPSSKPAKGPKLKSPRAAAGMGIYIALIIFSVIALFAKNYLAYDPITSLLISIILAAFFYIVVHATPEPGFKVSLILTAFTLDIIVSQGLLYLIPESQIKSILITVHVFVWIVLAIVLFLMGLSDTLSAGEKVSKLSWIILIILIGLLIFFAYPYLLKNPYIHQYQSHAEYYEIAKEELAKLAETFEETKNVWSDHFSCTFISPLQQEKVDTIECLENKRIQRYCAKTRETESERKECEKILREEERLKVKSVTDPTIKKPTKFKFVTDQFFDSNKYIDEGDFMWTINLEYENPREQEINVELSCHFEKTFGKEELPGEILSGEILTITDLKGSEPIVCQPLEGILPKGEYKAVYEAKLMNLETRSRVTRFFVGPKSGEELEEIKRTIETTEKTSLNSFSSSFAPKEFAWLEFGFGNPAKEPVITGRGVTVIGLSVANQGGGKLLELSYQLLLEGFSADCKEKSGFKVHEKEAKKRHLGLGGCIISDFSEELKRPDKDYVKKEYEAVLTYNYLIKKEERVKVFEPTVTQEPQGGQEVETS